MLARISAGPADPFDPIVRVLGVTPSRSPWFGSDVHSVGAGVLGLEELVFVPLWC